MTLANQKIFMKVRRKYERGFLTIFENALLIKNIRMIASIMPLSNEQLQ